MKVAIISYTFPPCTDGAATLMYNLCKYLPRTSFSVVTTGSDLAVHQGDYDEKYVLDHSTIRLPVRTRKVHDGIKFIFLATLKGLRLSRKGDINCFLSVFPYDYDLLAGYALHRLTGKPLIIYMHDLFSEQRRRSRLYRIWKFAEKKMFSSASRIIVTNGIFRDHYLREGIKNVVVLPSCVDLNENIGPATSSHSAISKRELQIVFTGSVYAANEDAILLFLEAAKEVSDLQILFATAFKKSYLKKVSLGFVPKEECHKLQKNADVLFLPLSFKSQYAEAIKCAFPIKALEYCAAGKPILAIVPSGSYAERFIRDNNVGIVVTEPSKEKIINAIGKLKDEETRNNFSKNALKTILFFDAKVQAKQFYSIIRNAVENNSHKESISEIPHGRPN